MLKVNRITVYYGGTLALHDLSIEVDLEKSELITLIGANGAGKTTLLMAISGIIKPKKGSIEFNGIRLESLSSHDIVGLNIAHVAEGGALFPKMTVLENLDLGAYRNSKESKALMLENVYGYFPILQKRRLQPAGTLSGGERQMLAIARGLMLDPDLLLLDEPSVGLSPILVDKLGEVISQLNKKGLGILLVEQNAYLALDLAHRAYVLETGTIAVSGKASDLLESDLVQKAYLGM